MIINYRIDDKPEHDPLCPYQVIRYGHFNDVLIAKYPDMDSAAEIEKVVQRETQDVKELVRNETLDEIRELLYRMLPTLESRKRAGSFKNLSIDATVRELQEILKAKAGTS